eukprot:c6454_g1_i1 orf=5-175(-)
MVNKIPDVGFNAGNTTRKTNFCVFGHGECRGFIVLVHTRWSSEFFMLNEVPRKLHS